jgi:hypothetical protein
VTIMVKRWKEICTKTPQPNPREYK